MISLKIKCNHALECPTGGNTIIRQNDVKYAVADFAIRAFGSSAVRDEPRIFPCRPAAPQETPAPSNTRTRVPDTDLRGDLCIRNLWAKSTDVIIDICVIDTDAKSYRDRDPLKVLESHERKKKKKYLDACLGQRRHFTPFAVSVDGLLGKEAKTLLQRLSGLLAKKWDKPYASVCGYVKASMSLAILRATHRCIRGSRIPTSRMSSDFPQWEDQAGLGLFRF